MKGRSKRRSRGLAGVALVVALGGAVPVEGQVADSVSVEELARQVEALTLEIEEMRLGEELFVPADTGVLGFGPAASRVYNIQSGVSVGGYGEILYENFSESREDGSSSGATDQLDALRGIVYLGYKFDDRFLVNTEIEIEHGSTSQAGSVSLEFAYLDYRLSDAFGIRGGVLLSPMGFVNELHEPPIFLGARRPTTESRIIPTTWRENGIGVFGGTDSFDYRVYLLNGLDGVGGGSSNASGFSASGLRGGRQKGSEAVAEGFGAVGRLDYVGQLGLTVGTSLYVGNSGHGRKVEDGESVDAQTTIWEGHVDYQARGLQLRGLYAVATVDQVEELNELRGLIGAASIGERLQGGYVQAGYDILGRSSVDHELIPFFRYEWIDTQADVPDGFASNPANDSTILTLGFSWKPLPQIVGKVDYEIHQNGADSGVDQFNIALGYLF